MKRLLLIAVVCVFFAGRLSSLVAEETSVVVPEVKDVRWVEAYRGVSVSENRAMRPRRQQIYMVRIDTKEKGIGFFSTPRRPDGFEPEKNETIRQRTNEFLQQHDLQVAVNANFFAVPKGEAYAKPGSADVLGVSISDGIVVSASLAKYPAFLVGKDGVPVIREKLKPEDDLSGFATGVAGNVVLLKDGAIVSHKNESVHPRTAVGISQDRRFVYLLVIDGRQKDYSDGATYREIASWLLFYGAWEGLNLDGGGSTTMVVQDGDAKAKVVNRPSDRQPRYNGNNLGVRALSLSRRP